MNNVFTHTIKTKKYAENHKNGYIFKAFGQEIVRFLSMRKEGKRGLRLVSQIYYHSFFRRTVFQSPKHLACTYI